MGEIARHIVVHGGTFRLKNSEIVRLSATAVLTFASFGCGYQNSANSDSVLPTESVISATANPLVAQYDITHSHPGLAAWVEFGTDTSYGRQTSVMNNSIPTAGSLSLSILVAGMRPQSTYHMRAHANWSGGSWVDQDRTFTTGALPNSPVVPQISIAAPNSGGAPAASLAPGVELLSLSSAPLATDLQGNIVWFCPTSAVLVKPMQNGHFILLQLSHCWKLIWPATRSATFPCLR